MIRRLANVSAGLFGLLTIGLSAPPISTTSSIGFTANPVTVGDVVTVTASITPTITDTGVLRLDQYFVAGLPAPCATPGGSFTTVASVATVPFSSVDQLANTSSPGSFGYRAHFVPQGGSAFHESQSACVDLVVNPTLCTGLQISAINAFGTNLASPPLFSGGFKIIVTNCGPNTARGVTAQGGTSAWTTATVLPPSTGSVGLRKATGGGNQILLWTLGDMAPGQVAELQINLTGPIKPNTPNGTVLTINGAWSATSGGAKSNYTDQITITVVNP